MSEEGADRVEIFSDDDDDFSSPEEGSDSEPMLDDQVSTRRYTYTLINLSCQEALEGDHVTTRQKQG